MDFLEEGASLEEEASLEDDVSSEDEASLEEGVSLEEDDSLDNHRNGYMLTRFESPETVETFQLLFIGIIIGILHVSGFLKCMLRVGSCEDSNSEISACKNSSQ